jgi:quercetin dioxygenase-like cupin family protein
MDGDRTVRNPATGETITFLETSAETAGARVLMDITLEPGGAVVPHSHRAAERFECLDGVFVIHHAGRDARFGSGDVLVAAPHAMHGFRNDSDAPATLRVTVTPADDLDKVLRTLAGQARAGRLVPGRPPRDPFAMASIAWRGRYYQPPMPRWVYWPLMGTMAALGRRSADRLIARYSRDDEKPG